MPLNQNDYRFTNIRLPYDANTVYCLYQDDNGLIWLGTKRGLINFNGFNFHLCQYKNNLPNENVIQSIARIDKYHIFVGSDKGIRMFNLLTWTYEQDNSKLIKIGAIRSLTFYNGVLYIGSRDNGLFIYDLKHNKLQKALSKGAPEKFVCTPVIHEGVVYYGSSRGLRSYNALTHKIGNVCLTHNPTRLITSILCDKGSNLLWVGTEKGLYLYNIRTKEIKEIDILPNTVIKSILRLSNRTILIGTEDGLFQYNILNGQVVHSKHNIHDTGSIHNNRVTDIIKDNQGNIWISTDNGVSAITHPSFFNKMNLSTLSSEKIGGNVISSILVDSHGDLWFGGDNGVFRMKGNSVEWHNTESANHPLKHNRIRAIREDKEGTIWLATDGGLASYDFASKRFIYHLIKDKGQFVNWIYDLQDDQNGNLWIGTFMSGLYVIKRNDLMHFINTPYIITQHDRICPDSVSAIYQMSKDSHGNIWVNSNEGLAKADLLNRKLSFKNLFMDH
ncbi:MAG: hypothetical protein I3J02_06550 [Prevotella sp.]|nr:hypothetical protein [Prevotella sp.]